MNDRKPIRSLEWEITTRCNYACEYCSQGTYLELHSADTSDDVIEGVLRLLDGTDEPWLVKLIGGEPFVHPRFIELCRILVERGHDVCTTTNLSVSERMLDSFVDATRGHLAYITASYHPGQIDSDENFMRRAAHFNSAKDPGTEFTVTAVGILENEGPLRRLADACDEEGITFEIAPYKSGSRFVKYDDKNFWKFVSSRMLSFTEEIRGTNSFGTVCHTGSLFGRITVDGDVLRCYNIQPSFYLGSVLDPSFTWRDGPRPCLSMRCTCAVPVRRNMVEFGNKASAATVGAHLARSILIDTPRAARFTGKWAGRILKHAVKRSNGADKKS